MRACAGAAFVLSGFVVLCVGTGMIPVAEESMLAPGWVIALCGAVLVLAGLTAFVETVEASLIDPLAVLFILSFAVVAAWVAFGADEGAFYGQVAVGRPGTREALSRVAFGIGAFSLVALAVGITFRWIGELKASAAMAERAGAGRAEDDR